MSESELVLLGDEAIALGAIHAGISAAYAYPGTPSTEITEYILEYSKENGTPFASWASNEKTAYEQALGVSFVGKRESGMVGWREKRNGFMADGGRCGVVGRRVGDRIEPLRQLI